MTDLIPYNAWQSSASSKVLPRLAEKGLAYEGCVLAGGRALVDSKLINEFLDEAYPEPPLMPDDPSDRHELRRFARHVVDRCLPARSSLVLRPQTFADLGSAERVRSLVLAQSAAAAHAAAKLAA